MSKKARKLLKKLKKEPGVKWKNTINNYCGALHKNLKPSTKRRALTPVKRKGVRNPPVERRDGAAKI